MGDINIKNAVDIATLNANITTLNNNMKQVLDKIDDISNLQIRHDENYNHLKNDVDKLHQEVKTLNEFREEIKIFIAEGSEFSKFLRQNWWKFSLIAGGILGGEALLILGYF